MSETYFLYHSIGMYPGKSGDLAAAMAEFAEIWGRPDDSQWAYVLGKRAKFLNRWSAILNAPAHSVTATENVTAPFTPCWPRCRQGICGAARCWWGQIAFPPTTSC